MDEGQILTRMFGNATMGALLFLGCVFLLYHTKRLRLMTEKPLLWAAVFSLAALVGLVSYAGNLFGPWLSQSYQLQTWILLAGAGLLAVFHFLLPDRWLQFLTGLLMSFALGYGIAGLMFLSAF